MLPSSLSDQGVYYMAILQDFILRFAWTLTLTASYDILRLNQKQRDTLVSVVAVAEVYRLSYYLGNKYSSKI